MLYSKLFCTTSSLFLPTDVEGTGLSKLGDFVEPIDVCENVGLQHLSLHLKQIQIKQSASTTTYKNVCSVQ